MDPPTGFMQQPPWKGAASSAPVTAGLVKRRRTHGCPAVGRLILVQLGRLGRNARVAYRVVPPEIVFADWASNPSIVSPLIVTSTTFTTITTFVPSRHPFTSDSSTKTSRSAPSF